MKYELVKCLQPLSMLAIYSSEDESVEHAQSCLRSMAIMEPKLVLHPVIDQAKESLRSLVEVCLICSWVT